MSTDAEIAARRFEIDGQDLGFPTFFHDGSSCMGIFPCSSAVASEYIKESPFEIAEIAPGKALMTLVCVHYTDTECGAYEEIAIAFFVKKRGVGFRLPYLSTWFDIVRGSIPSFTWRLPVSANLACQAGIQMWGFPKTIEDIHYENAGGFATWRLRMGGKEVLSYKVESKGKRDQPRVAPPVYSVYEGEAHVSYLAQSYSGVGYKLKGGELVLGDHPMAQDLRQLKISNRPLLAAWNGHLEFEMSAPQKV